MYKLHTNQFGQQSVSKTNASGSTTCIPFDPDNTDYQAFLRWCEEGNEPLPADEVTQ